MSSSWQRCRWQSQTTYTGNPSINAGRRGGVAEAPINGVRLNKPHLISCALRSIFSPDGASCQLSKLGLTKANRANPLDRRVRAWTSGR